MKPNIIILFLTEQVLEFLGISQNVCFTQANVHRLSASLVQ